MFSTDPNATRIGNLILGTFAAQVLLGTLVRFGFFDNNLTVVDSFKYAVKNALHQDATLLPPALALLSLQAY